MNNGDKRSFENRLDEYAAFRKADGRDPSVDADAQGEKGVGSWLSRQRAAGRRGTLAPEKVSAMDKVSPGWRADRS